MLGTLSWLLWKLDRLQFINLQNFLHLFHVLRVGSSHRVTNPERPWRATVYWYKSDGQTRYFLYNGIIFNIITRVAPLCSRPFPPFCSSSSTGEVLFRKVLNTSHAKHHIPQGHIPNMIPTQPYWNRWTTYYWKKRPPLLFPYWPTDTRTQRTNSTTT